MGKRTKDDVAEQLRELAADLEYESRTPGDVGNELSALAEELFAMRRKARTPKAKP